MARPLADTAAPWRRMLALGSKPLPLDARGCYEGPLRASWPVGP